MKKQEKKQKPQNSNQWLKKINWFNVLTLLVSLIALAFAWNANEIAKKENELISFQYTSEVVVLSDRRTGQNLQGNLRSDGIIEDAKLSCIHQIRFANLGGAKDAIVNFDTKVYYQETTSTFEGIGESIGTYDFAIPSEKNPGRITYEISDQLHLAINWLYLFVTDEYVYSDKSPIDEAKPIDFPLTIEGFDTLDTEFVIVYKVSSGNRYNLDNELGQVTLAAQSVDLSPVYFEIIFELASGNTLKTPLIECGAIGI